MVLEYGFHLLVKPEYSTMDAALIRHGHAVHRQLSHKVGIRGVGGGDLADILLPDELSLVGLEHERTHAHAGLIVAVVGHGGHGIDARVVRRTEGDADVVGDAGQLVDDLNHLTEHARCPRRSYPAHQ